MRWGAAYKWTHVLLPRNMCFVARRRCDRGGSQASLPVLSPRNMSLGATHIRISHILSKKKTWRGAAHNRTHHVLLPRNM